MVAALPPQYSHPPVALPTDSFRLQTSPLRGATHYADVAALAILKPGDPLELIAEPFNPHDRYAVRVHLNDRHIGYLPRESNHVVSRLLRQNSPLRAEVAWIAPDLNLHTPLSLHVLWDKADAALSIESRQTAPAPSA